MADGCPLSGSGDNAFGDRIGSIGGRPLFRQVCSEAAGPLTARLRHTGSSLRAKPDVRLGAQPGRSLGFGVIAEADIACADATIPLHTWMGPFGLRPDRPAYNHW